MEKPKCNEMFDNGSALPVLTHAIVLLYRGSGEGEGGEVSKSPGWRFPSQSAISIQVSEHGGSDVGYYLLSIYLTSKRGEKAGGGWGAEGDCLSSCSVSGTNGGGGAGCSIGRLEKVD